MKGYRTSLTDHLGQMEKYYFDNLYQLNRVDYPNGDVHQWSYDDIGNRVQQAVIPSGQAPILTNYAYYQNSQSRNSQLLQSDGASTYAWDNNGNLLTKGATNYTWDADNRLVGISGPSTSASYVYDYQGKRIKKTVEGVETTYLYQAEDIIKEASGGTITDYLHGIGIDDPVYLDRSGLKSYYFSDGLGSIREMTDATGTLQNSYSYGAWREVRAQDVSVPNSYGYTGREFAEDGMYFYRARYLDPGLGRFVSEDPVGYIGGLNFYLYVKNTPIVWLDPFGYWCISLGTVLKDVSSHSSKPTIEWTTYHLINARIVGEIGGLPPILYCYWKRIGIKQWEVNTKFKLAKQELCCCHGCRILETPYTISVKQEKSEEINDVLTIEVWGAAFDSDFLKEQACILNTNPNHGDYKLGE